MGDIVRVGERVRKLLRFEPSERAFAREILQDPWFRMNSGSQTVGNARLPCPSTWIYSRLRVWTLESYRGVDVALGPTSMLPLEAAYPSTHLLLLRSYLTINLLSRKGNCRTEIQETRRYWGD